jgi:Recombinational DNA repair protein (RecF pathway)
MTPIWHVRGLLALAAGGTATPERMYSLMELLQLEGSAFPTREKRARCLQPLKGGGGVSALDGVGPDELRIPRLLERAAEAREVVLALNATVDGQTTAHYIGDRLAGTGVTVTSLGQGVPVGGELDFLDDGTIGAAFRARRAL